MTPASKNALITGAARRVGRAIALELAQAEYDIAAHYNTSRDEAVALGREIESRGRRVTLIQGDLADPDVWSRIVGETVDGLGSLDVLINNASVFDVMSLESFDVDQWDRTLRVNVTAAAGLCHAAAPHLKRSRGAIVNLTDVSAEAPWSEHLAYCASKAALVNLTKSLARSLAPEVRVNAVSPGIAVFPDDYDEATRRGLIAKVPLRRPGSPEEIAKTVHFLCASADYMTGQIINVDGGRSIA
jgi:pteridine reductase